MTKLNTLVSNNSITVYGFEAFKGLESVSNQNGTPIIVSSLSPAIMLDMGICEFYAPVLPRGTVFNNVQEVLDADLTANLVQVKKVSDITAEDDVIIVSRHAGTINLLKEQYPHSVVLDSITPDVITDKDVVGTLPAHLVQYARRYKAVTIKDFDYKIDGDLSGTELLERIVLTDTINVVID